MKTYKLKNLDCAQCASKIENAVSKLDAVKKVSVNFSTLSMQIDTDDMENVKSEIYRIEPFIEVHEIKGSALKAESDYRFKLEIISLVINAFVLITGIILQERLKSYFHGIWLYVIFLSVYFFSGWKVFIKSFKSIKSGNLFDENLLMIVATIGAIVINALVESASVMFFFRLGEFFEELSLLKSRKSIHSLLNINPDRAHRITRESVETIHPESLEPDDRIQILPGERVPVDGVIEEGSSSIDTSPITGESVPADIGISDEVLSGTINLTGVLRVRVTKSYRESSASRIIELVENAASAKSPTEKFMTKFASWYTPAILVIALLIAVIPPLLMPGQAWNEWIYRALVILVISCPCALVISIPLTYFSGIGRASHRGILIKGSAVLDQLNSVDTVVLDKTGTITRGNFNVLKILSIDGSSTDEILELASLAEAYSSHPIAQSIRRAHPGNSEKAAGYRVHEGEGIQCQYREKEILAGNEKLLNRFNVPFRQSDDPFTTVFLAVDRRLKGVILIGDEIKKDSKEAVALLKKRFVKEVRMLTGDNEKTASFVAGVVGVDRYDAGLLPSEKLEKVRECQRTGGRVLFAGDGTNDAPVMAGSDVSLSMGHNGTDAAIETSDIVILNDSLMRIPEAMSIARKTRKILIQNIVFAVSVKVLFIVLSFFGVAMMWEAVFGDIGVAVIAILNSMRALR